MIVPMKNLFTIIVILSLSHLTFGQNRNGDYSFYDYSESALTNTDSIPDFQSKETKLKLTGTVYQSDGVTPASNVIVYIEQPDENGRYDVIKEDGKQYVNHRGWVKTNADGQYTFYTFMPGKIHRGTEFRHIHPSIKAPGEDAYDLNALLFDNDPALTKSCRKRLTKKGMADNILKVAEKDSMLVVTKNIVLERAVNETK